MAAQTRPDPAVGLKNSARTRPNNRLGQVRADRGRVRVNCRVLRVFSDFGSNFLARTRPARQTGLKILVQARPSNSSGRVGSGYFWTGRVGSAGSGSPYPGLQYDMKFICEAIFICIDPEMLKDLFSRCNVQAFC